MIVQATTRSPIPREGSVSGISQLVVGRNGLNALQLDGDVLYARFDDGAVYKIRDWGWTKEYYEPEKARQEISRESSTGTKKKSTKAKRTEPGRTPVRSTKKVRKGPVKAKGSKLQSSSGEDVRPSVPPAGSGDEVSS